MIRTIDRYLIRETLSPFLLALVVFTFILQIPPVMEKAKSLLEKGVDGFTILRILFTLLPQALGVTIPIASTSTGMDLRSALASSTDTIRGRCGPWALLLPPIHEERVMKPAAVAMAMAPTRRIKLRFFIIFFTLAVPKGRDELLRPLDGDFCALFLNDYHSVPAHGMPLPQNV